MSLTLIQKLVSVYEEIDHIQKAGHNSNQNYDFVRAADMVRAVRQALLKIGVYAEVNLTTEKQYTMERRDRQGNVVAPFNASDARCTIVFHDADSDAVLTASGLGCGFDGGDKAVYKAQTGALKYALRSAFLVPDEADSEADESVDRATAPTSFEDVRDSRPAPRPSPPKTAPATTSSVTPKVSSPAPTAAAPSTPPASNAPAADKSTSQQFPTEKELEAYRAQFKKLGDDLAADGGLKASKGLPINRKLLVFLLRSTGADKAEAITNVLWLKFFAEAEHVKAAAGLAALAELVNVANGITTSSSK